MRRKPVSTCQFIQFPCELLLSMKLGHNLDDQHIYSQPNAQCWHERGSLMRSRGLCAVAGILAAGFVTLPPGLAQDKTKVKGLITTHTGETIVVKTDGDINITVLVDETTKVQEAKDLGLRKENVSPALLIPGLK